MKKSKFIGCTVEEIHTGTFANCDEDLLIDDNWEWYDDRQIKYNYFS